MPEITIQPPPVPSTRKFILVKIQYDDKLKRIPGTSAEEEHGPGSLVVYNGPFVVGRFFSGVERWWIEES
jgi:hypothetical protein